MKQESKNYIVKNAMVRWAKVYEPDNTFPPPRWSVNIYPGDIDRDALRREGIQMRTDEKDGGEFFTAKRNVETRDGKRLTPPRVVDLSGKPFSELIGNGSICNIIINIYPWEFGKKKGLGAWLEAVQVVEHKPYVPNERVDFDVQPDAPGVANDDGLPF